MTPYKTLKNIKLTRYLLDKLVISSLAYFYTFDHLSVILLARSYNVLSNFLLRITDKEKNKFFRDFIFWQQEGLDIDEYHCLFINFGVNIQYENPQIRRAIMIFS